MSYGLTANDWMDLPADADVPPPGSSVSEGGLTVLPAGAPAQVYRSALIPVAFALPLFISALGYLSGGVQLLSDVAFVLVAGLCLYLLAIELMTFGRRLGIGAILIYGGVLVWFCHDYAVNWFLHDYARHNVYFPNINPGIVGRAMFYHCLFIEMMVIAFRFPVLRFAERVVTLVPEPRDARFHLALVVSLLLVGWSAFIFTADAPPVSIFKAAFWFLPDVGPIRWTVYRTNVATGWGSYVAQLIQVGQIGGIMAAVYALLIARGVVGRVFGWSVWAFWLSFAFPGERRGEIAFMALPVIGVVFLKFHAQRDPTRRKQSLKWLLATLFVVFAAWFAVQWQSANRMNNSGVNMFRAAGNTMFSEGLNTWGIIPDQHGYAYDTMPGETIVRPVPDTLWWLVTGPIPRMIWADKPVESFALWYSSYISHDNRGVLSNGAEGTTVSSGAVGYWYFRYGPAGVIEGGLMYGFLMGLAERSLRRAQGRPMKVMFALAFAAFMFRCYRDLWWHNLYPILIGGVVLWLLIRLVFGAKPDDDVPIPGTTPAA